MPLIEMKYHDVSITENRCIKELFVETLYHNQDNSNEEYKQFDIREVISIILM